VRGAALAAENGTLAHCGKSKITNNLGPVVFHEPATNGPATLAVGLSCTLVCSYQAQLIDAQTGIVVAHRTGKTIGDQTVSIPTDDVLPGKYQYVLRALKSGKPGTAQVRTSQPFDFTPPPSSEPPPTPAPVRGSDAPLLPPARVPLPTLQPTAPPVA
jgi:hypothetical protein